MNEIKPCPFCGSKNIVIESLGVTDYWLVCDNCSAEGPYPSVNVQAAIDIWNRRVSADNE